jgi:hypothetical protein
MKRIYTAESIVQVAHVRNLLEDAGIATEMRNDRLGGAVGEIPFLEAWPEVWVDERDAVRAEELIELRVHGRGLREAPWDCPGCGERIEGQFDACWHCGHAAPESAH